MGDFNAKLFYREREDEHIIGPYLFESPLRKDMAKTNRELLLDA